MRYVCELLSANRAGASVDQRFLEVLEKRSAVLVIGTGVSAALSGNQPFATWGGLIGSGIQLAVTLGATQEWVDVVRNNLDYGFKNNEPASVLSAAGMLAARLRSHGDYVIPKWLQETVGSLKVKDTVLAQAIQSLPFPILTTNYDQLLESSGRRAVDWRNAREMQNALVSGDTIGHLHGTWNEPDSVILTEASYQELLLSEAAMAVQRAASTLKSMVYIGYGAGLDDPNFSQLIHWHKTKFIPSSVNHFRLCLESEIDGLRAKHADDQIVPIAYGKAHSDLAGFLVSCHEALGEVALTPTGAARDVVAEARVSLVDELRRDAIIGESREDLELLSVDDVILPPVMLPVPHADYVKARMSRDPSSRIDRLDPRAEVTGADVLVLASDENNGLTTALKWLALEAASYLGAAVPIYVSFQKCRAVPKSLEEQVRRDAVLRGAIGHHRDALPSYVLALDNFSPYVDRISDRVLKELASSKAVFTVIGCAQGTEDEIVERLSQQGCRPVVRYLGRLSASDVRNLARLAWPSDANRLADQVLGLLESENLPRTPYTVGLLISVLVRGGALTKNASQTSILDDYVGLMLGRGDPHEDARFGLDQSGREAVLAGLAEQLVVDQTGGLTEANTVQVFQRVFDRFAWPDSPSTLLRYFLDRHILRREGTHISFARSSYLHLFAAKRAVADPEFRAVLLGRPLYYAASITDYAALYRHDDEMVSTLSGLLDAEQWLDGKSEIFDEVASTESIAIESAGRPIAMAEPADPDDRFFDASLDSDSPPFPIMDEVDVPPVMQLMRTLDLVSTVLRDSDQVEDLVMKEAVLAKTLHAWGELMAAINLDRGFRDFVRSLIDEVGEFENNEETLDELVKSIPAAMTLAGVGFTLASRKLTVVLGRVLEGEQSEEVTVSACFFLFALRSDGWVQTLQRILVGQRPIWVVRNFLLHLLFRAFIEDEAPASDQEDLLDLCVEIWQASRPYSSVSERKAERAQIRDTWLDQRLQRRLRKQAIRTTG